MSSESRAGDATSPCPRCGAPLIASTVRTVFWQLERPVIVEDIPAHVCSGCVEQFYDDDVSDALRSLAEGGFPETEAARHISVPVFSLTGRIRQRAMLPDDSHVD